MNVLSLRRYLLAALSTAVLMASGSAHAVFRAYLSVSGADNPTCSLAAPCRLLPAALTAVDSGGEIWMLDSGNFNNALVTITKSVTILAVPGELGSVVGISGNAFLINAAGIAVTLQNLNILSFSNTGDIGVNVANAASVTISNCNIFGFKGVNPQLNTNGLGIWVNPGANAPKVTVIGTTLRNNHHGIVVSGNGRATLSKTHLVGNSGVAVWSNSGTGTSVVHVSDSVATGNGGGFAVTGSAGAFNSKMYVVRSVATENGGSGFSTGGGTTAFLVVDSVLASNNVEGFTNAAGDGTFHSRGNSTSAGNLADATGTITFRGGN